MGDLTTVKIKKSTRDRLAGMGGKKETYDDIINHLMNFYEKTGRKARGVKS